MCKDHSQAGSIHEEERVMRHIQALPHRCPQEPVNPGSCSKMRVFGATLFASLLLFLSPALAGTVYQSFTNNTYNAQYFGLINNSGDPTKPSVAVANNRLELTAPASTSFSSAGLQPYSKYNLIGDYDIQVDFNLLNWPDDNGVDAGIVTTSYEVTRVYKNFGQGITNAYLVSFIGQTPTGFHLIQTSDSSGKLRLNRTGNTVSGYYWQNNAWQLIASYTNPSYGAPIGFYVGGYVGNRTISEITNVGFDNLKVTNAVFPSGSTPLIYLLLQN